jgi:hypothetical protein
MRTPQAFSDTQRDRSCLRLAGACPVNTYDIGRHMEDDQTTLASEIKRALVALEAGEAGPSPDDMAVAPALNDWQAIMMRYSCCLAGEVSGHPWLNGPITTSALIVLDPGLTWARTMSRFYRLGSPFRFVLANGCDLSLADVYGWPVVPVEDAQARLADLAVIIRRLVARS